MFNSINLNSQIINDKIILSISLTNEIIYEKEIYGKWIVNNDQSITDDTTEFKLFNRGKCYKHKDLLDFISLVEREIESKIDLYRDGEYYDSIIYKDNTLKLESNNIIYSSFIIPLNDKIRNKIVNDLRIFSNTLKKYIKQELKNIKGGVIKVEQLCKILDE
jgi:hypothetical protein